MDAMIYFSRSMLETVAAFLASEPMIYLFAIACLLGILKVFRAFLP